MILLYLGGGVFGVALDRMLPDWGVSAGAASAEGLVAHGNSGGFFHVHAPDFHVHYHETPAHLADREAVGDDEEEPTPKPMRPGDAPPSQDEQAVDQLLFVHQEHACPLLSLARLLQNGFAVADCFWSPAPTVASASMIAWGAPPSVWSQAPQGRGPPRLA